MDLDSLDAVINGENNKTLTKKHIAERQRRARINSYLEEIQKLTTTGSNTASGRLEKAEVLERAVTFIQNSQAHVDPNNNTTDTSSEKQIYKTGYRSCMNKLMDQVSMTSALHHEAGGLKRHLDNFLQNKMNLDEVHGLTHSGNGFDINTNNCVDKNKWNQSVNPCEIKREYPCHRKSDYAHDGSYMDYSMYSQVAPLETAFPQIGFEQDDSCDSQFSGNNHFQNIGHSTGSYQYYGTSNCNPVKQEVNFETVKQETYVNQDNSSKHFSFINRSKLMKMESEGQTFSDFKNEELLDIVQQKSENEVPAVVWRPW